MSSEEYLSFNQITEECKKFYEDYESFSNFTDWNKERFFKDNFTIFSKYIDLYSKHNFERIHDMTIEYSLIGISFELFIKLCALKIDWTNCSKMYGSKNKKDKSFGFAKKCVFEDLEKRIDSNQFTRCKEVINYIHVQRNNFVHGSFKGQHHYAVWKQVFLVMALLIDTYSFEPKNNLVNNIVENIEKNTVVSGLDFEDVGLMNYVNNLRGKFSVNCDPETEVESRPIDW